jgi:hypothetical protein
MGSCVSRTADDAPATVYPRPVQVNHFPNYPENMYSMNHGSRYSTGFGLSNRGRK